MKITDNAVSQWVMLDCFLAWHSAEICLRRCNISETLHDTELVSTDDPWETTQASCSIDWRGHLWHSVTEKSKIALASYGRPTLRKLSPYYCTLHFTLSWQAPRKSWGGTVKKWPPAFEMLPAPLVIASRNSDPPVKIWQIQPCNWSHEEYVLYVLFRSFYGKRIINRNPLFCTFFLFFLDAGFLID